jgi:hypothetical protein
MAARVIRGQVEASRSALTLFAEGPYTARFVRRRESPRADRLAAARLHIKDCELGIGI